MSESYQPAPPEGLVNEVQIERQPYDEAGVPEQISRTQALCDLYRNQESDQGPVPSTFVDFLAHAYKYADRFEVSGNPNPEQLWQQFNQCEKANKLVNSALDYYVAQMRETTGQASNAPDALNAQEAMELLHQHMGMSDFMHDANGQIDIDKTCQAFRWSLLAWARQGHVIDRQAPPMSDEDIEQKTEDLRAILGHVNGFR